MKNERNILREECCEIKKRNAVAIEEYEKLKEMSQQIEYAGKTKNQDELLAWIHNKDVLSQKLQQKYEEKIQIAKEIEEEIGKRAEKLNNLDDHCKILRKKVEIVRAAQTKHYYSLLKEGKDTKDTKGEGLQ